MGLGKFRRFKVLEGSMGQILRDLGICGDLGFRWGVCSVRPTTAAKQSQMA